MILPRGKFVHLQDSSEQERQQMKVKEEKTRTLLLHLPKSRPKEDSTVEISLKHDSATFTMVPRRKASYVVG